ncbi:hypothetical protein C1I95_22640 [Micromonospora craterilacus]|uniref:Uncharacterized protein n=1 Tax=Micromonospora craterilacus TaxID=1655439 RepID=A0A2W2DPX9_9ACTN|nr:hypothetical protein [Micromonospora craterilacus]PZG13982.1 hypothetical protein C1I95_22640 [Micromonospora craterilacus]
MPSVTSWTRLEPGSRSDDLSPGLQARTHDPLWLLSRQWQLGEFTGEDAGSPASVRIHAETAPVTTYRPHGGTVQPYDHGRPLEAVVEAGPATRITELRTAARTGRHFLRLLTARGRLARYAANVVEGYALTAAGEELDGPSRRWLAVMRHRVPSGAALLPVLRALVEHGTRPPAVPMLPGDVPVLADVARSWLDWLDTLGLDLSDGGAPDPADAWQPTRMEYRFDMSARFGDNDVVLAAPEYDGGRLDWYSFTVDTAARLPATNQIGTIVNTLLPAPAAYPGMPAARWWEFEDARVDFGRVEAEPTDLARLLLVEYATVYSNDWYLLPLTVPTGTVVKIRSLVVTDTFGFRTLVRAAGALPGDGQDFSLFRHTVTGPGADVVGGRSDGLLIAPAIADQQEAEPVEEVRMFRDEMANVAWAVETVVEGATGNPIRRHETADLVTPEPADGTASNAYYQLATSVPEHWFPLLPVQPTAGAYRLRRATVPRRHDGQTVTPQPLGQLLEPGTDLLIHEEEVPREGVHVTRARQRARWSDGSTHTWIGRRKRPGLGEGSSGLLFDQVVDDVAR